nr:chloroplast 50S ribosomal protein L20 [Passiflora auriculata]QKY65158.1 chloroplast 50S ribosomal protein L20 [Passiflora auriculata]
MDFKVCAMAHPSPAMKGYRGKANNCFRISKQRTAKALENSFRDRRNRKRDMRSLWVSRVNSATQQHDSTFSRFMHGLMKENILLNRKVLSQLSVQEPRCFKALVAASCNGSPEEPESSAPQQ